MSVFVVQYQGPFGYIKPWTAVRDSETLSQQFLTASIIEGMEKKLFPDMLKKRGISKICRHRLSYVGVDMQLEKTWSKGGFKASRKGGKLKTNLGILNRGILLYPHLHLVFKELEDAQVAANQHLCLCRNEDLLYPAGITEMSLEEFDLIPGFELHFTKENAGFKVGHNRYHNAEEMFGQLLSYGDPIRSY